MFFSLLLKHKNMHKTLDYSIHSSKKHRQYKSNKVNNTATKHSLCPGNGLFAHETCIIFVIFYVFFCFNNNKNTASQKHKNLRNK